MDLFIYDEPDSLPRPDGRWPMLRRETSHWDRKWAVFAFSDSPIALRRSLSGKVLARAPGMGLRQCGPGVGGCSAAVPLAFSRTIFFDVHY